MVLVVLPSSLVLRIIMPPAVRRGLLHPFVPWVQDVQWVQDIPKRCTGVPRTTTSLG